MKIGSGVKQKNQATMKVTDPATGVPLEDKDGKVVTITLFGKHSDEFRKAMHSVQNSRAKLKGKPVTAERSDRENSELLGAVTVSWSGFYEDDGTPAKVSQENAASLYHSETWLREQVDEFIGENSNFFS